MKFTLYAIAWIWLGTSVISSHAADSTPAITAETRAAAGRGDAEACFIMARAHLSGIGAPKNAAKALQLMKTAADQGHADATGGLGYFHMKGLGGVARDPREAMKWFRLGAEKGSAKSQLNLGVCLLDDAVVEREDASGAMEQRHKEGLEWIRKAADQGLAEAEVSLGGFYYTGEHGLAVDYKVAAGYFGSAARKGNADAQNILGTMNENGQGCDIDESTAIEWYRKAALQGNVRAQSDLGRALGAESADKARRIEALAWLRLAADQGNVMAEKTLIDVKPGTPSADFDEAQAMARDLRKKISAFSR